MFDQTLGPVDVVRLGGTNLAPDVLSTMLLEYRRGDDHVYRHVAGEHLLIALRRETSSPLFAFSDTAAVVWAGLAEWVGLDELVGRVMSEFEVEAAVAAADVQYFLEQLSSVGALRTRERSE